MVVVVVGNPFVDRQSAGQFAAVSPWSQNPSPQTVPPLPLIVVVVTLPASVVVVVTASGGIPKLRVATVFADTGTGSLEVKLIVLPTTKVTV